MNGLGSSTLGASGMNGNSLSSAAQLVGESLKSADDLNKIATLRKKIRGELASVETKLRAGAKDQLDATRDGISRLMDTRVAVGEIREQFVNVDRLCDDQRTYVEGFDKIGEVLSISHICSIRIRLAHVHIINDRFHAFTDTLCKRSTW